MKKSKKKGNNVWRNAFLALIFIILIAIIAFLAKPLINKNGLTNINDLQADENYKPEIEWSCKNYDITSEYYKMFPEDALLTMEHNCMDLGGTLTKDNREYSCYFDPRLLYLDCNTEAVKSMSGFCENTLKANYVCNPDLAFMGCLCDRNAPNMWDIGTEDDEEEGGWNDNEEYTPVTCQDIDLPMWGDLGGICAEDASCPDDGNCGHYRDLLEGEHYCACTETYFCGQYCYEYIVSSEGNCECPPSSEQVWSSRSTYECVPNGYYCENGEPIEETGPFPE